MTASRLLPPASHCHPTLRFFAPPLLYLWSLIYTIFYAFIVRSCRPPSPRFWSHLSHDFALRYTIVGFRPLGLYEARVRPQLRMYYRYLMYARPRTFNVVQDALVGVVGLCSVGSCETTCSRVHYAIRRSRQVVFGVNGYVWDMPMCRIRDLERTQMRHV